MTLGEISEMHFAIRDMDHADELRNIVQVINNAPITYEQRGALIAEVNRQRRLLK